MFIVLVMFASAILSDSCTSLFVHVCVCVHTCRMRLPSVVTLWIPVSCACVTVNEHTETAFSLCVCLRERETLRQPSKSIVTLYLCISQSFVPLCVCAEWDSLLLWLCILPTDQRQIHTKRILSEGMRWCLPQHHSGQLVSVGSFSFSLLCYAGDIR